MLRRPPSKLGLYWLLLLPAMLLPWDSVAVLSSAFMAALSNVLGRALIGLAGVTCRPLSNHLWPESGSLGRNMAAKSCSGSLRDWRLGGKGWVMDPHKLSLHLCSVFSALASWQYTTYWELRLYFLFFSIKDSFFLIFPITSCLLLITLPPYPQSSSSFSSLKPYFWHQHSPRIKARNFKVILSPSHLLPPSSQTHRQSHPLCG